MLRLYEPCIPVRSKVAPSGQQWLHEIKDDGYRIIARKLDDKVRLITRGGYDWLKRYPLIAKAADALMVKSATIDGEAVVCGPDGVSDFERLHSRNYDALVFLYAFDLLELDGEDLRQVPLEQSKAGLTKLLWRAPDGIHLSEHISGDGPIIFKHACKLGGPSGRNEPCSGELTKHWGEGISSDDTRRAAKTALGEIERLRGALQAIAIMPSWGPGWRSIAQKALADEQSEPPLSSRTDLIRDNVTKLRGSDERGA